MKSSDACYVTGLSANVLKIIALVCMTIDHIGMIFFPQNLTLRVIGRLAFPVFAFFIAEGCFHTKHKWRYLFTIFLLGLGCQLINIFIVKTTVLNILLTFSLSICLIYLYNQVKSSLQAKDKWIGAFSIIMFICGLALTIVLTFYLPFDYGFFGVLLPLLVSLFKNKYLKIIMFTLGLVLVSWGRIVQLFGLLSVPLIWFYNGKKGKFNLKYMFYVYYPAHLLVLEFIKFLL